MSKDVGALIEMGLITRIRALEWHIDYNFMPAHPQDVKDSMMSGFKKYWAGKIDEEELAKACCLKNVGGLYQYFNEFMEMNDEPVDDIIEDDIKDEFDKCK